MVQFLFPLFLYGIGLFPVTLLKKQIPVTFFAWTAFAWGALAWAISAILCLWLPLPFTFAGVALILALLGAILIYCYRHRLEPFDRHDLRTIAGPAILLSLLVATVVSLNMAQASPDSIKQLLIANKLGAGGLQSDILPEFGYWGVFLLMLQAPARWAGVGYFNGLQAAFGFTLLGGFHYFCRSGLTTLGREVSRPKLIAGFATLFLASTPFLQFQFLYIHNNLIASTYLLIGVGSLWLALNQRSSTYLGLGVLSLLGFSLARTETMLYATIFLIIALTLDVFDTRVWLEKLLPYALVLSSWYLWLLISVNPETKIMTPERIMIILTMVGSLYVTTIFSKIHLVRKSLIPRLHAVMLVALVLILFGVIALDPSRFARAVWTFAANLTLYGIFWWGATWWMLIVLLMAVPRGPALSHERLFVVGIVSFFLLMLNVTYVHGFRLGWGDSSNRAFTHILPVIVLYFALKTGPVIFAPRVSIPTQARATSSE